MSMFVHKGGGGSKNCPHGLQMTPKQDFFLNSRFFIFSTTKQPLGLILQKIFNIGQIMTETFEIASFYPIKEEIQQKSREILNFIATNVNHYCGAPRCLIKLSNTYFLSPQAYILISGIKCEKKKIFKNFSKNFLPKKISYTPHTNFGGREKNFFFQFYSIYQNVRTGQLK